MTEITVLTLFPTVFQPFLATSILKRAVQKGLVKYNLVDLRQFGQGKHQVVDDRPYGGGPGMLLKADVLAAAVNQIRKNSTTPLYTVLMSASGQILNQNKAKELSKKSHLLLICGRYEGVDQRFIDQYVDEEISIGNYVLSGGELPALVVIESLVRLIPQVLKKEEATCQESFTEGLLEYPQYTKPVVFEDLSVPEILLSGHHQKIKDWQKKAAISKTYKVRPDLISQEK